MLENLFVGKVFVMLFIVVVLNKIKRIMLKLEYVLYRGEVFKKNLVVKFMFKYVCVVKKFLLVLVGNDCQKDKIVIYFFKLEFVLVDLECEFISQLRINYNLIKCLLDGFFLLVKENLFKILFEMLKRKV